MPTTSTAIATPTSRPDVEPVIAEATQTATAATGGTHRTGTSHQSIFDGYHRSCSADMDTPLCLAPSDRLAGHGFRLRRLHPRTSCRSITPALPHEAQRARPRRRAHSTPPRPVPQGVGLTAPAAEPPAPAPHRFLTGGALP